MHNERLTDFESEIGKRPLWLLYMLMVPETYNHIAIVSKMNWHVVICPETVANIHNRGHFTEK